jgi:DNA-binding Lrp family transcriptional regulator
MLKKNFVISKWKVIMDELDSRLLSALHRDARASLSELAETLGVTRTTVRSRLQRLKQSGEIVGFTVLTRQDVAQSPVRGLMMLEIEGRGTERTMARISAMPEVRAVHSTNGSWDLIAEISTDTLAELDEVLFQIRRMEGITRSETNLLLSTRKGRM